MAARKTPQCKRAAEPRKARVLIVDDHPIVRERLAELINQEPDLMACCQFAEAQDALESIERNPPVLALVDISLKSGCGIELVKDIKLRFPKVPVLIVSMHDESLYAERALRAGARGYITKQEATKNISTAIRQVLSGRIYVSERIAATLLARVAGVAPDRPGSLAGLTDRELEIFDMLGEGLGVRRIAETLHISHKTVEAHREHIKAKLHIGNGADLLRCAIQHSMGQF